MLGVEIEESVEHADGNGEQGDDAKRATDIEVFVAQKGLGTSVYP